MSKLIFMVCAAYLCGTAALILSAEIWAVIAGVYMLFLAVVSAKTTLGKIIWKTFYKEGCRILSKIDAVLGIE